MADPSPSSTSEKCELRIEGMTCGSCVEVRSAYTDYLFDLNPVIITGDRGYASPTAGHPFCQGSTAGRARCRRVRPQPMDCTKAD